MPDLSDNVFLTGATGFIGQHLVKRLVSTGCSVSALVFPDEQHSLPAHVNPIPGDITDASGVSAALREISPKLVFHLAAVGVTNPGLSFYESYNVNVQGTINILEAVRTTPCVQRLVLFGSSFEYGARRSDDDGRGVQETLHRRQRFSDRPEAWKECEVLHWTVQEEQEHRTFIRRWYPSKWIQD